MDEIGPMPPGFLWGTATSAFQIEGSPLADGAGASIWHEFTRRPGAILNGDTGDVASDHYHRYAEDVGLMQELGLNAYRFSLAWPRLLPDGTGRINGRALGFYDRLLDALLAARITPFVTLYHWDLPAALERRGGWLNDDVAEWFAEFAALAARHFGDRIEYWTTLNEPAIVTEKGYVLGIYAPGHRSLAEAPLVARNLMRAHGAGVQVLRAERREAVVGVVVNLQPKTPATDTAEDRAAAARADAFRNRQFLDPILLGRSPEELPDLFGASWRPLSAADLALISQPIDFVGVNYYTRNVMTDDPSNPPTRARVVLQEDRPHTLMGWEIYPAGLTEVLTWVSDRYGPIPLYVTENGAAFDDPPPRDRTDVADPDRVSFLKGHLQAARVALAGGVDLRGYFIWSLLDNFEWSSGFSRRFGVVHVDFRTQRRTVKSSGRFIARTIRQLAGTEGFPGGRSATLS